MPPRRRAAHRDALDAAARVTPLTVSGSSIGVAALARRGCEPACIAAHHDPAELVPGAHHVIARQAGTGQAGWGVRG
jgi:hypothetical protein